MVILYSTGCPRCNVLKRKLDEAEIAYIVVDNMDSIMKVCNKNNIDTVPILEVPGDSSSGISEYMNFSEAIKWVGERNAG